MNDSDNKSIYLETEVKQLRQELDETYRSVTELTNELTLANEALRAGEEKQKQIILGLSIPTFVIDRRHIVTHWNRACEKLTGIAAEEIIGTNKQWMAYYSEERPVMADLLLSENTAENITLYFDQFRKSAAVEGAYEAEGFFSNLGETGRYIFFTAAPLKDATGRIEGVIETLQDITERRLAEEELKRHRDHLKDLVAERTKNLRERNEELRREITERERTEKALRESEERLELALKGADLGLWTWNVQTGEVFSNKRTTEIIEHPVREKPTDLCIGESYIHSEDRFQVLEKLDRHMKGKSTLFEAEYRLRTRTNKWKWVSSRGRIVEYDHHGEPLRIAGTLLDITDRKEVEEALRESENRYRILVETMREGLAVQNENGCLTYVNNSLIKMLGYSREKLIGRRVADFLDVSSQHVYAEKITKNKQGGKSPYELTWLRKDGQKIFTLMSPTPILDSENEYRGSFAVISDISARKRAEDERQAHLRFLENMGHIDRIIQQHSDQEEMLSKVLKAVMSIFNSDRAWLLYPCDPQAPTLKIPVECTRPEYPGAFSLGLDIPMTDDIAKDFQTALDSDGPVRYDPESEHCLPEGSFEPFQIKSQMVYAINPRRDKAWIFGIHQCSYARVWTEEEQALFEAIGRRISDALGSLLFLRDLQKSEAKYRELVQLANSIILRFDTKGRVTFFNEYAQNFFGYTEEEIMGRHLIGSIVPETETSGRDLIAMTEDIIRYPNRYAQNVNENIKRSGERVWISWSNRAIYNSEGHLFEILSIGSDMTERKRTEQELTDERERFKVLIEESPLGVALIGADDRYIYVNPQFSKMFGYTIDDIPTGKAWIQKAFPDLQHRREALGVWQKIQCVSEKKQYISTIYTVTCKDNNEKEVQFRAVRLKNGSHLIIYEDVTERQKAELEKERLEKQLRQAQKMEAIGTLAGGIAHDFNNILAAIIGFTEISLRQVRKDSTLHEKLLYILDAGLRAGDLVKQILTFSSQTEQEYTTVRLIGIVEEALKLLRATIPSTIDIRPKLRSQAAVTADPTQIHQVLMNLCTNAAHAMMKSGGILEVILEEVNVDKITAAGEADLSPGEYIRLTVSDTGHGMDKATLNRIFDPFFTTKKKEEGTGMGLAMVHGIVKGHGGAISVHSEPNKGTVFHIYFPLLKVPEDAHLIAEQDKLILVGREHILFVDDEEPLVELGREMLEPFGYKVTGRTSSLEALQLFKSQPDQFDLVITDYTMPEMTGLELASELLKIQPDIPIILCTGFSQQVSAEKAAFTGIKRFILKPILSRVLVKSIREVISDKQPEKQLTIPLSQLRKLKVLVAEDDAVTRKLIEVLLEEREYTIIAVNNGQKAVENFDREDLDLIFMDVQMPELNGIEATRTIREKEKTRGKHTPIVALSGYTLEEEEDRCREAGMDGCLSKPIQRNDFFRLIDELFPIQSNAPNPPMDKIPDLDVLDKTALMNLINGDIDLLKELVHIFFNDLPDQMTTIHNAVEKGDGPALQEVSHALKGRCAHFFASDATDAAWRLEKIGRTGNLAEAQEAYADLEKEIARLKKVLESIMVENNPASP